MARKRVLAASPSAAMDARSKEVTCGLILQWHFTITDTRGRQLLRTRTDGLGRYAVAGLPEDVVTVVLSAPHRTPAVTQVLPATGHKVRRDFVLAARH